ncbi:MAG: 2-oxo acid dehydrogenase subunit E2 [Pseudonocardiaceae bacterium]
MSATPLELWATGQAARDGVADCNIASVTRRGHGRGHGRAAHWVIYPSQVALLGFGAVVQRPWAIHGLLGVRPVVPATLPADHRASDGTTGAGFRHTIDHLLQQPEGG